VQRSPFENQGQRASRQLPSVHFQRVYDDQRLGSPILGVEVRWLMIIIEHLDDNAKEPTDLRHVASSCSRDNAPGPHSVIMQHTTRVHGRTMSIWRIEYLASASRRPRRRIGGGGSGGGCSYDHAGCIGSERDRRDRAGCRGGPLWPPDCVRRWTLTMIQRGIS
jgi:hypothetical protein